MMRRVLVLGASGFIGRRVIATLAATDGITPVAGVHRASLHASSIESLPVDACNEESLLGALSGMDAVVNCVAGSPATIAANALALRAAAGRSKSSPHIIHLSSMAVYGSATGEIDENTELNGDLGPYSEAKITAETALSAYPRTTLLRPGCVYGPGSAQWSERIARLLLTRRVGDLGADGDGICNLIHVDDVATAILTALHTTASEGQAFNLVAPAAPTWNDYFLQYARALGAVPIARVSHRRMLLETRLFAPPLKVAELGLSRLKLHALRAPPPIPPSLLRLFQQEIKLKWQKAEQILRMQWTPLNEGLSAAAANYRAMSD